MAEGGRTYGCDVLNVLSPLEGQGRVACDTGRHFADKPGQEELDDEVDHSD